jgi:hypothetical protein
MLYSIHRSGQNKYSFIYRLAAYLQEILLTTITATMTAAVAAGISMTMTTVTAAVAASATTMEILAPEQRHCQMLKRADVPGVKVTR